MAERHTVDVVVVGSSPITRPENINPRYVTNNSVSA